MTKKDMADQIIQSLFTNGIGESADRLVLVQDGQTRNLGGWGRLGAQTQILRVLESIPVSAAPHTELVICAAIRMDDGYIIRGHRHSDCMLAMGRIPRYAADYAGQDMQGFLTSLGRFVSREEAAALVGKDGKLYSEDVY